MRWGPIGAGLGMAAAAAMGNWRAVTVAVLLVVTGVGHVVANTEGKLA